MNIKALFRIGLVLALLGSAWRINVLSAALKEEQQAHAQTCTALETAVQGGQRWATVAQATLEAAEAQKASTEACLDRESKAQSDAEARAAIMAQVKPRPRTEPETQQVVDDATRKAGAARLNRAW